MIQFHYCPKCGECAFRYDTNASYLQFSMLQAFVWVHAENCGSIWQNDPWESNQTGTTHLQSSFQVGHVFRCRCKHEWIWKPDVLPKYVEGPILSGMVG